MERPALKDLPGEIWSEVADYFSPKELFLVAGTLSVVVIWLYFGSAQFFTTRFGVLAAEDHLFDWYKYLYYHINSMLLLGLFPLLVLYFSFGMSPRSLGVQFGDWYSGVRFVLVGIAIVTPIVYVASFDPQFQQEYPLTKLATRNWYSWILWELTYLVYYVGWETYFRGSLLFGLRERLGGSGAIAFQTAVSTLVHLGAGHTKPFLETMGAIPGGLIFGAIAYRTNSIVWPLLLHWYIGALMDSLAFYHAFPK